MARTLKITTSYNLGAGDGVSAETQTASTSLSSGTSATIAGSAPITTGVEYVVADFLGAANKAKGLYIENRDADNALTVKLGTATGGTQVGTFQIAVGGVMCLHDSNDAITHIGLIGLVAAADFVLCFCE